jgi:hypothetical protein
VADHESGCPDAGNRRTDARRVVTVLPRRPGAILLALLSTVAHTNRAVLRIRAIPAAPVELGSDSPLTRQYQMGSARTHCPNCRRPNVVDLADLLYCPQFDYFRCGACHTWWMVPKHADGPAVPTVFGTRNPSDATKTRYA